MIGFNKSKKGYVGKPIRDKDVIEYLADMPVVANDNRLSIQNNVEYACAKFIQASQITKRSIKMFFNNPDLTSIRKYLSYKNVDKIKALLTELPYGKVTC